MEEGSNSVTVLISLCLFLKSCGNGFFLLLLLHLFVPWELNFVTYQYWRWLPGCLKAPLLRWINSCTVVVAQPENDPAYS